jgi:hypothetical protein
MDHNKQGTERSSASLADRNLRKQLQFAQRAWGPLATTLVDSLKQLLSHYDLSISSGELICLQGRWYVTNAGLLRIARDKHCYGIHAAPIKSLSDPPQGRWTFRAEVYKSSRCRGFASYGDADPSNVSPLVRGAEMRVAETRAVNRALRKAYGIGICSVEEIGSYDSQHPAQHPVRKLPPESTDGNGNDQDPNGNGTRVRDRLCQIIRQHKLDAELVKAYAVDFCGTKALRDASREQVENFVAHLADWAAKDRNALLCQLNSFVRQKAGAA